MESKYFNEAIIGNKNILATFTSKGEMQRMYFPSKDNRQYIEFFHTVCLIVFTHQFVSITVFIRNQFNGKKTGTFFAGSV